MMFIIALSLSLSPGRRGWWHGGATMSPDRGEEEEEAGKTHKGKQPVLLVLVLVL